MASAAPTVRDGDRAAKACNHVFIGNKGASGRARTQDERPVRFVAVGDVLRDRGGPRKAGKGARWAFIGRFRLAAEVTGKVTLLLLGWWSRAELICYTLSLRRAPSWSPYRHATTLKLCWYVPTTDSRFLCTKQLATMATPPPSTGEGGSALQASAASNAAAASGHRKRGTMADLTQQFNDLKSELVAQITAIAKTEKLTCKSPSISRCVLSLSALRINVQYCCLRLLYAII